MGIVHAVSHPYSAALNAWLSPIHHRSVCQAGRDTRMPLWESGLDMSRV